MDRANRQGKKTAALSPTPGLREIANVAHKAAGLTGTSSDFDLNSDVVPQPDAKLRPAAVLIALEDTPRGVQVILTKRSSGLKHHPGQISFPGGAVDKSDADPTAAALRESWEEIGLAPENTEILGILPAHRTVTSFNVTPILARVRHSFTAKPEPGEVAEVFSAPLSHLTNLDNYQVQSRIWQGTLRHYDVVPYGPYYIWGATARMLRMLAQGMAA